MLTCKICNREFKNGIGLSSHVRKTHNYKQLKDYAEEYDKSLLFDDSGFELKCEICGRKFKDIMSRHIVETHKMPVEEYQKLYPDSKLFSSNWKEMMDERNKSQKMRDITKERNKEEYMRKAISERNKDPEFIKKCKEGIKNSESWHEARTKSAREKNLRDWKDPEYAKKMLNVIPLEYGKKRIKYFSEYYNREFILKSYSEVMFVKICESLKIENLVNEPFGIQYIADDGLEHTYFPDFLVDNKYLVETKYDESPNTGINLYKSNGALKYCEENNLTFCWYKSRYKGYNVNDISELVLCRSKIE